MTVRATLRNGSQVDLAPDLGATPNAVVEGLLDHAQGLTGSAMPDVWLGTADGGTVRYAEVTKLDSVPDD